MQIFHPHNGAIEDVCKVLRCIVGRKRCSSSTVMCRQLEEFQLGGCCTHRWCTGALCQEICILQMPYLQFGCLTTFLMCGGEKEKGDFFFLKQHIVKKKKVGKWIN